VSASTRAKCRHRACRASRLDPEVFVKGGDRLGPNDGSDCSHFAATASQPGNYTGRFAALSERMMGLEPTTFCMATGPFIPTLLDLERIVELNPGRVDEPSSRESA